MFRNGNCCLRTEGVVAGSVDLLEKLWQTLDVYWCGPGGHFVDLHWAVLKNNCLLTLLNTGGQLFSPLLPRLSIAALATIKADYWSFNVVGSTPDKSGWTACDKSWIIHILVHTVFYCGRFHGKRTLSWSGSLENRGGKRCQKSSRFLQQQIDLKILKCYILLNKHNFNYAARKIRNKQRERECDSCPRWKHTRNSIFTIAIFS